MLNMLIIIFLHKTRNSIRVATYAGVCHYSVIEYTLLIYGCRITVKEGFIYENQSERKRRLPGRCAGRPSGYPQCACADGIACKIDVGSILFEIVIQGRLKELNNGTCTEIGATNTDDNKHVTALLDFFSRNLDARKFFLIIVIGEVYPTQKSVACTALFAERFCFFFAVVADSFFLPKRRQFFRNYAAASTCACTFSYSCAAMKEETYLSFNLIAIVRTVLQVKWLLILYTIRLANTSLFSKKDFEIVTFFL